MLSKVCARCRVELSVDNFRKEKRVLNGLTSWCRSCEKEYRLENKEKSKNYSKAYYEVNKEHLKAYQSTYNQNNVEKVKARKKKYYAENIDKIAEYRKVNVEKLRECARLYRLKHKDRIKAYMKTYSAWYAIVNRAKLLESKKNAYRKNLEIIKPKVALYKRNNRAKFNERNAKRRSFKLQRTPSWLTQDHYKAISEFYIEAKVREKETGIKFHVDHIIPLLGETVCGLHVPWNLQVITAYDNLVKGNRLL